MSILSVVQKVSLKKIFESTPSVKSLALWIRNYLFRLRIQTLRIRGQPKKSVIDVHNIRIKKIYVLYYQRPYLTTLNYTYNSFLGQEVPVPTRPKNFYAGGKNSLNHCKYIVTVSRAERRKQVYGDRSYGLSGETDEKTTNTKETRREKKMVMKISSWAKY
jgi:hypothetical protein